MAHRTEQQKAADEFCSCMHLNTRLHMPGSTLLAEFVGLDYLCMKWLTPFGQDVTALTEASAFGEFGSSEWTLQGWVLDERSVQRLREEFPDRYGMMEPLG